MLASTYVLKFCNLKTNWGIKLKNECVCSCVFLCVCAGGTDEPTNQPKNAVNLTIYL